MFSSRRSGFTLIELLIVITIIGILAAIALPKFSRVRERAHFKAMMSDLRNLQAQQEIYFAAPANNYSYASSTSDLGQFAVSDGVEITITSAGSSGWGATAAHAAMSVSQTCAVFAGTVGTVPSPASTPGVVTCTGE
jgi:prepilin-type N-terminal cleavage/methylation domain-containing protein